MTLILFNIVYIKRPICTFWISCDRYIIILSSISQLQYLVVMMIIIIYTKYSKSTPFAMHHDMGVLGRLQISGAIWSRQQSPRGTTYSWFVSSWWHTITCRRQSLPTSTSWNLRHSCIDIWRAFLSTVLFIILRCGVKVFRVSHVKKTMTSKLVNSDEDCWSWGANLRRTSCTYCSSRETLSLSSSLSL